MTTNFRVMVVEIEQMGIAFSYLYIAQYKYTQTWYKYAMRDAKTHLNAR